MSSIRFNIVCCACLIAYAGQSSMAQSGGAFNVATVYNFSNQWLGTFPSSPLKVDTVGTLYGQAESGGTYGLGTLYSIKNGIPTVLHSFHGDDGSGFVAQTPLTVGRDGKYYGTTTYGGTAFVSGNPGTGNGVLFRVSADGVYQTLHLFSGLADGGSPPGGVVIGADGSMYGVTRTGGSNNHGVFYSYDSQGTLVVRHSFTATEGNPNQIVLLPNGHFLGTTFAGGASGDGTVFDIAPDGTLKTIYQLVDSDAGHPLRAPVVGKDGNYNLATFSLSTGGAVLQVSPNGAEKVIHAFAAAAASTNGSDPDNNPLTVGPDGTIYGATRYGGHGWTGAGTGNGTIFRISPTHVFTTAYAFLGSEGANPMGGVAYYNHALYGSTSSGGANGEGATFKLTGTTLTKLADFGGYNGSNAQAGVVQGSDGAFYGTTYSDFDIGGYPWQGPGSIFRVNKNGMFTQLHQFHGDDGQSPYDNLTVGTPGNYYGTCEWGGNGYGGASLTGNGLVFQIRSDGTYTILHKFSGLDGANPAGSLTLGTDGFLYGTTINGGANGTGVIFRLMPDGTQFTRLYSFTAKDGSGHNADGASPADAPLRMSDGTLYGTTIFGGANGFGNIFKFNGTAVTTLHSFTGTDGAFPQTPLIIGTDGLLHGATNFGATGFDGGYGSGYGTVYHIATNGSGFTVDHTLSGPEGATSWGAPLQAMDGNYYGTMSAGGNGFANSEYSGGGTLYQLSSAGVFSSIYAFSGVDGYGPVGALKQAYDGSMWGVTTVGGLTYFAGTTNGQGTVFRVVSTGIPAGTPIVTAVPGNGSVTLSWTAVPNASQYNIFVGTAPDAEQAVASTATTGTSATVGNLVNGFTYFFTVDASNIHGEAGQSVEVSATPSAPITFTAGLHLMSSPYDYAGIPLDTVFGYSGVKLAVWDPTSATYAVTPNGAADAVNLGIGYWVRLPQAVTLTPTATGAAPRPFAIQLKAGWNQVGDPFVTSVQVASVTVDGIPFAVAHSGGVNIFGYDTLGQAYVANPTTLDPGQGYWVYAPKAGTLVIPNPPLLGP